MNVLNVFFVTFLLTTAVCGAPTEPSDNQAPTKNDEAANMMLADFKKKLSSVDVGKIFTYLTEVPKEMVEKLKSDFEPLKKDFASTPLAALFNDLILLAENPSVVKLLKPAETMFANFVEQLQKRFQDMPIANKGLCAAGILVKTAGTMMKNGGELAEVAADTTKLISNRFFPSFGGFSFLNKGAEYLQNGLKGYGKSINVLGKRMMTNSRATTNNQEKPTTLPDSQGQPENINIK